MALLTEEQIKQLIKMASITSTARSYHDDLCEWNGKQATQQFEPDWSKAPDDATSAVLSLTWITKGGWAFGHIIAEYERPAPVITPHPHAEMMMKYAEVAARRVDPWAEFEVKFEYGNWDRCTRCISFSLDGSYRHIGDNK